MTIKKPQHKKPKTYQEYLDEAEDIKEASDGKFTGITRKPFKKPAPKWGENFSIYKTN